MGTFTWSTGLGMLVFGLAVTLTGLMLGFIILRLHDKQKRETDSRSAIEKQIEGLRR